MEVIRQTGKVPYSKTAVALGNFDGLHTAHMTIIARCRSYAREHGCKCGVLLFSEHSRRLVSGAELKILTTEKQKLELLERAGMDFVYIRDFDEAFMRLEPEEFVKHLTEVLHPAAVCVGYDYRFGYKAAGDVELLKALGNSYGFETVVTDEIDMDGSAVKSTLIRSLIAEGNVKKAAALLGRPVCLEGIVERGLQNGRKMGIPTANISYEPDTAIPKNGVYAGYTYVRGIKYKSVINVGSNPTFGADRITVESHILDFDRDIYGEEISAEFMIRLRDDIKFDSVEMLIKQIKADIDRAGKELI